ncbi:hypothetical protein KUTeg_011999 [Tegillarca granosa]|uniref:Uncharacterized protein n=1 Tax=Tegillarca granosa TaxID=220873 RepID=A0ABQ9EY92_TEGGR|nr:hypothetical protein KUTeg_011999 [Tegillarca granosa]
MNNSTERHRIKGFKGLSGLLHLRDFEFVYGMPPDYMHGVLLGVTKNLMYKWFSSTQCKRDYFFGNKLKLISKRMQIIQTPEFIERLPRDLETHYNNFETTELQSWLLYYAIPCLTGILKEKYLEHFALLSEAIYLTLGDAITEFVHLYDEGSCGLNVHNIGSHLSFYVKKLGPLWSWSCFSFKDSNSMLLQAVHGTGNVTNQIMRIKEAQGILRNNLQLTKPKAVWTNLKSAENCEIAGATEASNVKKFNRVSLDGRRFYSAAYTRMKRTCHVALTNEGEAVVFALTVPLQICTNDQSITAGNHLISVKTGTGSSLLSVDNLLETLLFIDVKDHSVGKKYIVRMPNVHGH